MQKVAYSFVLLTVFLGMVSFSGNKKEKVKWMTIANMQEAYKKNPRPILIDVYTDWCGWCKVMDRETYGKQSVADYINEHYYPVKLDAESKESFEWNGKKFDYNAEYKSNDLAIHLLYGQMSYPSTVFLSSLDGQPAPMPGFLKPTEIEPPLRFFGDGVYKTKNYPEFMKGFKAGW